MADGQEDGHGDKASLIDPATLTGLAAECGAEILPALREEFDRETREALVALDAACADAEPQAAERALHALKGSAATLGLTRLAAHAGMLEREARAGGLPDAAGRGTVAELAARSLAALDAHLEDRAPAGAAL